MGITYNTSRSTVKPDEMEISKHVVFLRKDLHTEEMTLPGSDETITIWAYKEAILSHEEFEEYSKLVSFTNAINGVNNSKNISELIARQDSSDNNMLIVMEGIADLYEKMSNIQKEALS